MDGDDRMFWERLAEMPWEEHEQECVLRRERVVLQMAMLLREKAGASERGENVEAKRLGTAHSEAAAQLTLINERIKYIRRLMDAWSWRNAVKTVLGDEAYEQLREWRTVQETSHMPVAVPE